MAIKNMPEFADFEDENISSKNKRPKSPDRNGRVYPEKVVEEAFAAMHNSPNAIEEAAIDSLIDEFLDGCETIEDVKNRLKMAFMTPIDTDALSDIIQDLDLSKVKAGLQDPSQYSDSDGDDVEDVTDPDTWNFIADSNEDSIREFLTDPANFDMGEFSSLLEVQIDNQVLEFFEDDVSFQLSEDIADDFTSYMANFKSTGDIEADTETLKNYLKNMFATCKQEYPEDFDNEDCVYGNCDECDEEVIGSDDERDESEINIYTENFTKYLDSMSAHAFCKNEKLVSLEYSPFTEDEFIAAFNISDSEIEENAITIDKFKGLIPQQWQDEFTRVTISDQFISETNKFFICSLIPNFDNTEYYPASFIVYKKKNGEFASYIYKTRNFVTEDGSLFTSKYMYDPKFLARIKKQKNLSDKDLAITCFKNFCMETRYNEAVIQKFCEDLFVTTVDSPLMSANMFGKVCPSTVCKQYKNGYVYFGQIIPDNSPESNDFIHDFGLPKKDAYDFYIRLDKNEISNNDLPAAKEVLRESTEGNSLILDHQELDAMDDIVFIDLSNN